MNNIFRIILTLFIGALLTQCNHSENRNTTKMIEKSMDKTIAKFEQFPKKKFSLVRAVKIGSLNIDLQLYATEEDHAHDRQKIITIMNRKGMTYFILLFSNTYRDYWQFQFDDLNVNTIKSNTTFEDEFINAFEKLGFIDSPGIARIVSEEIFLSLLNCHRVTENDSLAFRNIVFMANQTKLPDEDLDSCKSRFVKNFDEIIKELNPKKHTFDYNTFWDFENKRVYQIQNLEKKLNQKTEISIKTYRQDCIMHLPSY
jgi:hypothetical protein